MGAVLGIWLLQRGADCLVSASINGPEAVLTWCMCAANS